MKSDIDYIDKLPSIRTINIESNELYFAYLKGEDLVIKNNSDSYEKHFSNIMPANLDLIHLYQEGKLNIKPFLNEYYSYDLINVSFKYPLYLDEKGERIFEKDKAKERYSSVVIREHIYLNGFILNNKKYVRYKRSSGAAKSGSCLFIKEELYALMNRWSKTGLDEEKDLCHDSLTSYEAYKALSLSSIIKTIHLNPYNILFVKDFNSVIKDEEVIKISYDKNNGLSANKEKCDITNNIFDGEGLLDASIFEQLGFKKKGMMLLRNRFFKCCAFNTNLRKWFKENNIKSVKQLNGVTFAKDVKDIVLVVSESCLKYLKMVKGRFNEANIKKWCDSISEDNDSLFGIVKTDKKTRFFDGEMVETTYQLLNTLEMKEKDVRGLMAPYIDYINKIRDIKHTPEFARFYLEGETHDKEEEYVDESEGTIEDQLLDYSSYSYKHKVCLDLIKLDGKAKGTEIFKKHVYEDIISSFAFKLYNGRSLVHGTYATLFGNPLEFLKYIILGKDNKPLLDLDNPISSFNKGEIYCSFFDSGASLLGSRAPHTTMGNILCSKNKYIADIDRWFNLTDQIVVVDAINNNIQHRLSGCDYDSDSMLLTDNKVLVKCALLNYDRFLVPYASYSSKDKKMDASLGSDKKTNLLLNLNLIDRTIAKNNVGRIVNYSQLLNSHLWNQKKKKFDEVLYSKIAILSVLSGAEIDSSKRTFDFSTTRELNRIIKWSKDKGYDADKPVFYANISNQYERKLRTGEIEDLVNEGKFFKTTMDILWQFIASKIDEPKVKTIPFFSLFDKDYSTYNITGNEYKQADKVIEALGECNEIINKNRRSKRYSSNYELEKNDFQSSIIKCYKEIRLNINSRKKVKLVLKKLSSDKKYYNHLYLFLYILNISEPYIEDYTFASLFNKDENSIPTLIKVKEKEKHDYTLFDRFYYRIDEVDKLINLIL